MLRLVYFTLFYDDDWLTDVIISRNAMVESEAQEKTWKL